MTWFFIILAAICNAGMDRVENENYFQSVFAGQMEWFWYKRSSWKTAPKIFGWKFDAWHCFKSLMIVFVCFAIVTHKPFITWLDFIVYGVIWNLTFNLFYNIIFKKS